MRVPNVVKRFVKPLPQWLPVAVDAHADPTRVVLHAAQREFDVTTRSVVAALRPLTLAVALDEAMRPAVTGNDCELRLVDRQLEREIGTLRLRHTESWRTSGLELALLEVAHGREHCVRGVYGAWNRWLQDRSVRRSDKPGNFYMPPESVLQTMIFYMRPRQVVLVTVDDGEHSNVFPMDLLGPMGVERFTLALRSTSQSVPTMQSSRRVALSDVAARDHKIAYQLGAHHRKMQVDWPALPFGITRSRTFSLPVPSIALRVRELEILDFRTVGSHTFFVTRIVTDESLSDGARFCHTSGIHQHFLRRHNLAFPLA